MGGDTYIARVATAAPFAITNMGITWQCIIIAAPTLALESSGNIYNELNKFQ